MPLAPSHPLVNSSPFNTNKTYLYAVMGASNTIGSMLYDEANNPEQNQYNNTLFEKKISHLDVLSNFSTPINNSNASNYNLLNEDGAYGYTARLSTRLREYIRDTICVVPGGESATPLSVGAGWYASRNISDPFDMTTRYGQMVTRIQNAQNIIGTQCRFIVTNMAGRDAALNVLSTFWYSQYLNMIEDIRSDLNNLNLVFVNIGLGPTPSNAYTNYPAWNSIRSIQDTLNNIDNIININPITDLGYNLENHVQNDEIHYNSLGYNGIADEIIARLFE